MDDDGDPRPAGEGSLRTPSLERMLPRPSGINPERRPHRDSQLQAIVLADDLDFQDATTGTFSGLSQGLVEEVEHLAEAFALRYWLVDNSGSMQRRDGKRMRKSTAVPCTRFEELGQTLLWHAELADGLQAWTQFRLLNPAVGCAASVTMGAPAFDAAEAMEAVKGMARSLPLGQTPLCDALGAIAAEIRDIADQLRQADKRVIVVVATDGEASDGDIIEALRLFVDLPVTFVIRLCTDDERILAYWNDIDNDRGVKLDLDVVDDVTGEAIEVGRANGWLTYSPVLQRLREFGSRHKIVDLLDERPLTMYEIRFFVVYLLGSAVDDEVPHPAHDLEGFLRAVRALLREEPFQFDPLKRHFAPWFNFEKLTNSESAPPIAKSLRRFDSLVNVDKSSSKSRTCLLS